MYVSLLVHLRLPLEFYLIRSTPESLDFERQQKNFRWLLILESYVLYEWFFLRLTLVTIWNVKFPYNYDPKKMSLRLLSPWGVRWDLVIKRTGETHRTQESDCGSPRNIRNSSNWKVRVTLRALTRSPPCTTNGVRSSLEDVCETFCWTVRKG